MNKCTPTFLNRGGGVENVEAKLKKCTVEPDLCMDYGERGQFNFHVAYSLYPAHRISD